MQASHLPRSFLDTYNPLMSFHGCKVLCIVINFQISLSSSLLHFKNGPVYPTSGVGAAKVFIYLMRFLIQSLVSRNFLVFLRYFFQRPIFPSNWSFPSLGMLSILSSHPDFVFLFRFLWEMTILLLKESHIYMDLNLSYFMSNILWLSYTQGLIHMCAFVTVVLLYKRRHSSGPQKHQKHYGFKLT